jgi:hypothetical protein
MMALKIALAGLKFISFAAALAHLNSTFTHVATYYYC